MTELALLALASSLWPTLVAVVVVAIQTGRPRRLLFAFLLGGLATTIGGGVAIVYGLRGTGFISGPRPAADPPILIAVGLAAVAVSYVSHLMSRRRNRAVKPTARTRPTLGGWPERAVSHGGLLAFGAGAALNVLPGLFPIVALKDIAECGYGPVGTLTIITSFYIVMFWMLEVPLLAYILAPRETARFATSADRWLRANGRLMVEMTLGVVGLYVLVRGLLALAH